MKDQTESSDSQVNRRDFLKGGSIATLMTLLGGVELRAQAPATPASEDAKEAPFSVKVGVIGLGPWGRDMVATLARFPQADIAYICDTYPAMVRRAASFAPKAVTTNDYRKILADKDVKAVVVATPTHLHRDIAVAALKAGKHVYCEAPLAHTLDDALAIARAAKAAKKQVFQAGLQMRSEPQRHFLMPFIRAGAMGRTVMARAQWHKKQSWRAVSPNPERERELNWRLRKDTSLGLIGEIGIHQVDAASWIINARPVAVTGFGSVLHWNDGRDVADTVHAIFEYPREVCLTYDATLANSFDADYEMYYGSDAAIMLRENKAWMFKEVDSPLLGWEVYARKDNFYKETGIALVANATKLAAQGANPQEDAPFTNTPLYYALESFLTNVNLVSTSVEDFITSFGEPTEQDLANYLRELKLQPAAGVQEGFEAAVIAIKASEAVQKGAKITFKDEWFKIV